MSDISNVKVHGYSELVRRLRMVAMLKDPGVRPYEAATITLRKMSTGDISPAQRYVLRSEFEKVRNLRWSLLNHNIDILALGDSTESGLTNIGFVTFEVGNGCDDQCRANHDRLPVVRNAGCSAVTLLPPIIEASTESDGSTHHIINDGMHRCYLARASCIKPYVVVISGVPKHLPYYAYPLAGGWNDVVMIDEISKGYLKKFHRSPDGTYQKYYRSFDTAFINVGGPRGNG